jgi:AbrB family looped-hinge helix DNA binding protein
MSHVIHTKLGEGRRVVIPAELRQQYGLKPGDSLVLEPSNSGITVRPLDDVIQEVQEYFAAVAPAKVVLSEELLRDRREEAAKEADLLWQGEGHTYQIFTGVGFSRPRDCSGLTWNAWKNSGML